MFRYTEDSFTFQADIAGIQLTCAMSFLILYQDVTTLQFNFAERR